MAPLLRDRPANVRTVHAPELIGMDEHPARALVARRRTQLDPRRHGPGPATARPTRSSPRATPGAGMAAAVLILGTPARRRPARRSRSRWSAPSGRSCCSTSAPTRTPPPENLAQYARMGAIFSRARARRGPAAGRAALDRRGEGQGRRPDPARHGAARRDGPQLHRQRRGQGPHRRRSPTSSCATPSLGNVVIKFFEGLSGFIFDQLRAEFRRGAPRPARVPAAAAGHRADPHDVRLRGRRRVAAARRPRRRDHHARPREAAHDRARGPGRRHDGARAGRGADRRGARRRARREPDARRAAATTAATDATEAGS